MLPTCAGVKMADLVALVQLGLTQAHSSPLRVLISGPGGRRFKSSLPDQFHFESISACGRRNPTFRKARNVGHPASRRPLWIASGRECRRRRRTTSHRTFTPYFCVIGGTIPFKRRYSASCP